MPENDPVLVAAAEDTDRLVAAPVRPASVSTRELHFLVRVARADVGAALAALAPEDVARAAGLDSRWEPLSPIDPSQAERLATLADVVGRIGRASGSAGLRDWFRAPLRQLGGRSPMETAASGDYESLGRLASSMETFTVS